MPTEVIDIVIRQKGARSVQKQLGDIAGSAGQADKQLLTLNRTLGTLATGAIARQLATTADAFTLLGNRTRVFAADAADAERRLDGIVDVASKARAPLDATATVFQRLSIAQDSAGLSTQNLLDITETLTKAVAVSGATAQEAEGALRQLSQGIAANRLSGQEFNSVIEQTPRIAQAIADSIGVEVGALRTLANEGKLTRDVVIGSFEAQADAIESEFQRVLPTLGQAFENLQTSFTVFLGELDRSTGTSQAVASGILSIAKSLLAAASETDRWVPLLEDAALVLAVIAASTAASTISKVGASIASLNKRLVILALTNPFTAIVAAAGLAAAAAFRFRDSLITVGEQQFNLRALANIFSDEILPAVEDTLTELSGFDFEFPNARTVFNDLVRGFNIVARVGAATATGLIDAFRNAADQLSNFFTSIPEAIAAASSGNFEQAGEILGSALTNGFVDPIQKLRDDTNRIINDELATDYVTFVENAANNSDVLTEATQRTTAALAAEAAAANEVGEALNNVEPPKGVVELGQDAGSIQKLKDDIRGLREEFDPALELTNEYTDRINLLNQALDAGIISNELFAETQGLVNESLATGLEELNFEKLEGFSAATAGARDGFRQFSEDLGSQAQIISEGVSGALNTSLDAFAAFASGSKVSAKDFARSVIGQISKVIIKLLVLKALQSATGLGGSGGFTGLIGQGASALQGAFANGGSFEGNQGPILVGEKGPEIINPSAGGRVIPNEMIGAAAAPQVNVQVVNVDDPNSVPDALNTKAGEEAVLNVIQRNPDVLQEIS